MCLPSKTPCQVVFHQDVFPPGAALTLALNQFINERQMDHSSSLLATTETYGYAEATNLQHSTKPTTDARGSKEANEQEEVVNVYKRREHCVQHNYHDHANDDETIYRETTVVCKGGVTVPFPMKLHDMIEHIALNESELSHIVSWRPHGRCFKVKNIKEFANNVLPRFFEQRKYASFQRQLNLYGFNRITIGPDKGSYYHELFLRSKRDLSRCIYRKKVKGTGTRMASNPQQEPNFYLMDSMPPSVGGKGAVATEEEVEEAAAEIVSDVNVVITPPTPSKIEEQEDSIAPMPSLVLSEPARSIQSSVTYATTNPFKIKQLFEENDDDTGAFFPPSTPITDITCAGRERNLEGKMMVQEVLPPKGTSILYGGCHISNALHNEEKENNDNTDDDDDNLRFIFGGMPFHSLEMDPEAIRHSLHRVSLSVPPPPMPPDDHTTAGNATCICADPNYRSTGMGMFLVGDGDDISEMEFVADLISTRMDDNRLNDYELGHILDRIVHNDISSIIPL